MKILISGSQGYIGSALVPFLRGRGHDVTGCDIRPGAEWQTNIYWVPAGYFEPFDVVIHLAAHSSVAACEKDRLGAMENNVAGLSRLVGELGGRRIIFASSGSVYNGLPGYPELDAVLRPSTNLYDTTKLGGEQLLAGANAHILRLGTVCGPSPVMRMDTVLNRMVWDAVKTGRISIFNPLSRRPLLALDDLCGYIAWLVEDGNSPPSTRNVGNFNTCILDIGEAVARTTGCEMNVEYDRPGYDFAMDLSREPPLTRTLDVMIVNLVRHYLEQRVAA